MYNLLRDPLVRVRLGGGGTMAMSLPGVYDALSSDQVSDYPALRPHQRHAWHAFLAQLGVIALHRAGHQTLPAGRLDWEALLRGLTPEFSDDEPWRLVVDNAALPAFMQCPAPSGLAEYRRRTSTADDLDLLVTAKNHDVKTSVASAGKPDDWLFALVDLQTMSGFLGAGNYGIARMNGGFSARPCLGLAPADGGLGSHLFSDIGRMLSGRPRLLERYEMYFDPTGGLALTWLEPWDGTQALDLRTLDPYFIEICRRVRLVRTNGKIAARTAGSKMARIAAKAAKGNLGDFWTPVSMEGKALSLTSAGFRYDRLYNLIFRSGEFRLPAAMQVGSTAGGRWRLVARGVAGGQGKTDGYYQRTDISIAPKVASSLFGGADRDTLAQIAAAQLEEIQEVQRALRLGIGVAASGGRPAADVDATHWALADPYMHRLDSVADSEYFAVLEKRFLASGDAERDRIRAGFARRMIASASDLLDEAIGAVPCPAIRRHRSRVRAHSIFWQRLRTRQGVFSDQPEIFVGDRKTAEEEDHAA